MSNNIIVIGDRQSVINFSNSQSSMVTVANTMLEGVKTRDTGIISDKFTQVVTKIRGLDTSKVDGKVPGFFGKLFGQVSSIAQFIQSFEEVKSHIIVIQDGMEQDRLNLNKDIRLLDELYNTTLEGLRKIEEDIELANQKLNEVETVILPNLTKETDDMAPIRINDMSGFR